MTALFSTRRRAEEFAAVVDGRGGSASGETERLLGVVATLRAQRPVTPRPDFSSDLRDRLMAEARTVLTAENAALRLPTRPTGRRERRMAVAASVLVLVGGTAGMAAAAQDALPGEALYPIKRGIEQAQVGLSISPAGKGRDLLHQANDRLDEVQGLIEQQSVSGTPQIPATLTDFTRQAQEGADLLMTSFTQTRDPDSIRTLRTFTIDGIGTLQELAGVAPADAQDELAEAALALSSINEQASALCDTCVSDLPTLELPKLFLAATEAERALRGAGDAELDNSHPVVVDKRAVARATVPESGSTTAARPEPTTSVAPSETETDSSGGVLPSKESVKKSDLGEVVGGTVGGVTGTVGGLAETLLPDPTGDLLP
jgi:hypothetical protein